MTHPAPTTASTARTTSTAPTSGTEPITALVWRGDNNFEFAAVPIPALKPGETLVRLSMATICGSDRHTVSGRRSQPCPSVLGHEGVGIVVATENPAITLGQRVTFAVTAPCHDCDRCRAGFTAKCRHVLKTGHEPFAAPWALSGTYATHILLRAGQPVVAVPSSLADAPASIAACAGATVMAVAEVTARNTNLTGSRTLIVGMGMLGLIAADVAVQAGAQVTAIDPDPRRREWAEALGAQAFAPEDVNAAPSATTVTDNATNGIITTENFDISWDFSGAPSGVETCVRSLDIGGTAVLAGSVATGPDINVNPEWLVRGWRTITGVHNYEPHHLTQAVEFLAHSRIDWAQVLSPAISLHVVPKAFESRRDGGLRTPVLIG